MARAVATCMSNQLCEIETVDLDCVVGGENLFARAGRYALTGARVAGRVAGKVVPVLRVASAGYSGYQGYSKGRAQGHGVLRSVGDAAQEAASDATFGLIPHVR